MTLVPATSRGGSGGGVLSSSTGYLTGDVTMTTANVAVDGPSVGLAAGSYLLIGHVTLFQPGSSGRCTIKLWDGTTVFDSGELILGVTQPIMGTLMAYVSSGSAQTYRITCQPNVGSALIKAAATVNGAGNTASGILALQFA